MSQVNGYKRTSIERRVESLKQSIYTLALEEISEGVRADRLRSLFKELRELEAALRSMEQLV
jgi:hypothetical protein